MIELKGWKRRAAYAAVFVAAFAVALRQTFPAEAVRERLVLEAAAQGWQVKVADVGPAGMLGVRFTGVMLESRDGTRLPLEDLRASLRFLPLLLGRRGLDFEARLFEGRVNGLVEERRATRRVAARVSGVDLSKAAALRKSTGLDLAGTLEGVVDLTLDAREPAKSAGRLDLRVDKAAVLGGQLQIPAMGGALTVPRADLGAVVAQATVKEGKLAFDRLEARSPDLEAGGEGLTLTLQPRLAYSTLFGKAHLKLSESFWQKSGSAALKGVAEMALAPARGRDGAYWFQLFGTAAQPQARPAPQ
jgi:type II secretion system protein N